MALICNNATVIGKTHQIWCDFTKMPCLHTRYCAVSMKYYQTDAASRCKVKEKQNGRQNNQTGANDSI